MIIRDRLSAPGYPARPNEDACGAVPEKGLAWVIDGATGLAEDNLIADEYSTDAQWFAHSANALLAHFGKRLDEKSGHAPFSLIRSLLEDVTDTLQKEFDKNKKRSPTAPFELPCASMCLVYIPVESADVHCFGLGDCPVLIETEDGVEMLENDPVLAARDAQSAALATPYLAEGLGFTETRKKIAEHLTTGRGLVNTAQGYPIFSLDKTAPQNMRHELFSRKASGHALLLSDGFYALVDKYGCHTHETLMNAARKSGLAPLYDLLRKTEQEDDPDGKTYPRLKQSDDATAMLLQF